MLANTALLVSLLAVAATPGPDTAEKALSILEQNCGNDSCHGGPDAYRFDVRVPASLIDAGAIKPGQSANSELVRRVEAGIMPLGGYKGRPGTKLPAEDIRILREWIDEGAPAPAGSQSSARRPFISESEIVSAIFRDLQSANATDRAYLRYYSLANLWNNPELQEADIDMDRAALSKLVNHLSWKREITTPASIGPDQVLLRIDLRDYNWTVETWDRITAGYPYDEAPPYIRVDWFVANASKPPLYHDILRLPQTLSDLEAMLRVDAEFDLQQNFARRFGVRDSGVSRNNRALERHSTVFGAYWKSFDFGGNSPEQDIFRDPLDLHPDGGEIIFHLPNGLQGYFIVNRQGRRLDDAPVNIVRDRTNTDDPVVHDGRSCIGCHVKGMNAFRDEIVSTLDSRSEALFDLDRARLIYPGQPDLERLIESDNHRFSEALIRAGTGVPVGPADEPVNRVSRRYEGTVTAAQAAADLSIEDPNRLRRYIEGSVALQVQGFGQFLGTRGGMKRDAWEHGFPVIAGYIGSQK
jgi:hypothetical protein